ncbi:hypothetical protein ABVT39_013021 [Epinephelus coioides]
MEREVEENQTKRPLKARIAEHKAAIRNQNMDYAIARHYVKANHGSSATLRFWGIEKISPSQGGGDMEAPSPPTPPIQSVAPGLPTEGPSSTSPPPNNCVDTYYQKMTEADMDDGMSELCSSSPPATNQQL